MKEFFVHDWIVSLGGAEKVLFDWISKSNFDETEIFCLFSDRKQIQVGNKTIKINPLISNKIIINKIGYRNLMPFFPLLMKLLSKKIKKSGAQKIFISSFAVAKNIDFGGYKTLYLHSPMQYIRDSHDEYIAKFRFPVRQIFQLVAQYLRKRDLRYSKFEKVYFNSYYTKSLAQKLYNLDGKISYPQIDLDTIQDIYNQNIPEQDYYIYIGRLVKFSKEVDKIIRLFNETGEQLLILGAGPDEKYLRSIANDNIIFLGYVSDQIQKFKLISMSRGLINITKESFGIVTAEALLLGKSVFGYNGGASTELVDQNSGILVPDKNHDTLLRYWKIYKTKVWDKQRIKENFFKKYI